MSIIMFTTKCKNGEGMRQSRQRAQVTAMQIPLVRLVSAPVRLAL